MIRKIASNDKQTLLKEIISNLQTATDNCLDLITEVLRSDTQLLFDDCHCRKSLDMAVWTQPEQIKPAGRQKLAVLFE